MKYFLHTLLLLCLALGLNWLLGPSVTDFSTTALPERQSGGSLAYAEPHKPLAVDWQMLRELDYKTGQKTPTISGLVAPGVTVRVPGFMVPLEDTAERVTEFMLLPYALACMHVPPPPPNQMIYVTMAAKKSYKVMWDPVWVEGTLQVVETATAYGEAAYTMSGMRIEPY
ncbi:MAG: DUF3299 domain-containing protein [Candidatus Tectimicrobiota bacterium]